MSESTLSGVGLPPRDAIAYLREKTAITTEHWADLRGEAHARAFTVAGAASEALLKDLRAAVERALTHGDTPADFRKQFDQIVQRYGWEHTGKPGWRANVIYATNVSTAYSAGQYRQMTTPEHMEMFPFWRYQHNHPMRPRPQHVAWSGTVLPADDPWWNTHWPPNGWGCQCSVEPMSRRDMREAGRTGPDTAPPLDMRPWRNPKTGEVIQVPAGIDPSFGHNPGREWLQNESAGRVGRGESPARRPMPAAQDAGPRVPAPAPHHPVEHAPAPAAQPAHLVDVQHTIQDFLDHPTRRPAEIDVGTLPADVQHAIGAETPQVRLSSETLEKQLYRHPDLTDEDYRLLPELLAEPTVVARQADRRVMLLAKAEKLYRAVVKATADGSAAYLLSFHRTTVAKGLQALRDLQLLKGSPEDLGKGPRA